MIVCCNSVLYLHLYTMYYTYQDSDLSICLLLVPTTRLGWQMTITVAFEIRIFESKLCGWQWKYIIKPRPGSGSVIYSGLIHTCGSGYMYIIMLLSPVSPADLLDPESRSRICPETEFFKMHFFNFQFSFQIKNFNF